ncbi:MAG: diguanylate cyclase domain-containing protein [Betaproteobacteria bacterium]
MTKEVLVDGPHATAKSPAGARRVRRRSRRFPGAALEPGRMAADPPDSIAPPLERALEVGRERLGAAQHRVAALEAERLLLRHQVALLQRTVVQLRRFACHDELTGLPNRRLLMDRYNQAVALAARRNRRVALLFLDLDGFKKINDTHGHAAGDSVLRQVAERLRACVRTSDTACRYGGDEFVILLPELQGREGTLAVARKIRARLAVPCIVDGVRIAVTASIGVAVYPADGRAYDDLMRVTDGCMYRDKARDAGRRAAA